MAFEVRKAKRQRRPLKISLEGLSGSGKTFSALRLAFAMRRAGIGKRIVVADSENESAGLYDGVRMDGEVWEYEVCPIPGTHQNPGGYAECYEYLVGQGFDLVVMDSLSHAWHGAMEQVDAFAARNKGDKFGGWAKVTPDQRRMLSVLTDPRAHLIATMRVKSEYERVAGVNGKDKITKVGMKTDQRDGAEYEFDCVVRLDLGHDAHVEKVRGASAMDGRVGNAPGPDFWKPLFDWWLSAEAAPDPADVARKRIATAATAPDLLMVWESLPVDVKKLVLADKDRRKAELLNPPPPPANPEPDPEPDHPDAWEDADTRLSDACERVGTSPADALRLHAAALGRTGTPRVTDLTIDELRRLTALVETGQAPAGGTLFTPGEGRKPQGVPH